MAVDRRLLYAGLFLAAIGTVAVTADLAGVERGAVLRALQLWPLALIALGAGIVLRRTRASLPAGVLAAVAPGLLIGGGFVLGPPAADDCGTSDPLAGPFVREGHAVELYNFHFVTGCGTSHFRTQPGDAWRISAARSDGLEPRITDTGAGLEIVSVGGGWHQLTMGLGREDLDVVLPAKLESLGITANANHSTVDLADGDVGLLALEVNGSNVFVDASRGTVGSLGANVKFGNLTIALPSTKAFTADVGIGAGNLRLCQPPGSGLQVHFRGDGARDVTVAGAAWESDDWSGGEILSSIQIEVEVRAEFASIEINPIGGCS